MEIVIVMVTNSETVRSGAGAAPGEFAPMPGAPGVVVFVHGVGGDDLRGHDERVAGVLRSHRLATLRLDPTSPAEAAQRELLTSIAGRADSVGRALDWLRSHADLEPLRVGLLGAGLGAAAALLVAARDPSRVAALVLRGGAPDLVSAWLSRVRAPTLLVVAGEDTEALDSCRRAVRLLECKKRLETVPGATHRFNEPGALRALAHLSASWFSEHLRHQTAA